jgi:hypothetical protein
MSERYFIPYGGLLQVRRMCRRRKRRAPALQIPLTLEHVSNAIRVRRVRREGTGRLDYRDRSHEHIQPHRYRLPAHARGGPREVLISISPREGVHARHLWREGISDEICRAINQFGL